MRCQLTPWVPQTEGMYDVQVNGGGSVCIHPGCLRLQACTGKWRQKDKVMLTMFASGRGNQSNWCIGK